MTSEAGETRAPYLGAAAIITLLLFIDGFDLFLLGKIAPAIAAGYGQQPADMRLVFTWHQLGLAAGAFLMPVLADRFGLRRLLVIMTFFVGAGTLASSFAPSLQSFAVIRGFTGLFLAGILPVALALLSELVPKARLGTILSIAMVGMSAGAAANSVAAAWMLDRFGWQSGLWLGALLPFICLPLVLYGLPEARRFSQSAAAAPIGGKSGQHPIQRVFSGHRAAMTITLWFLAFLTLGHTALVASWLPTFFQELGGISIQRFAVVSMLTIVGGALGTLAIGWLQDRFSPLWLTALALLGNGLGLVSLGMIGFGTVTFAALFTFWSFLQSASITGLNLLLIRAYPVDVRATGQGWAAGFGRIGGIAAPAAGAAILTAGVSLSGALWWSALPMLVIAILVMPVLAWTMRRQLVREEPPMAIEPIVETRSGKVRGIAIDNAFAFLGIRYAQAERFEAPTAPAPASAVVDAIAFGPVAPQRDPNPAPGGYGIVLEKLGGPPPPAANESEDCQFLNVWCSTLAPAAPKPVMVWLHPGFFMVGSGASGNGATLAARGDVVVVSLNHRLNLFGYTHLDDLNGDFRQSGNVGMLDIVAALEWIRDNIDRFGGDPKRVMVFGASGGGMKTAWLMASPKGNDLLHRAGAQSGPCLKFMERSEASAISEQLLKELGLAANQANELRRLPVEQLLAAYHRLRIRNRPRRFTHLASFAPVLDPHILPRHPFDPDASPLAAPVPMLLGWNREDMTFFAGNDMGLLQLDQQGLIGRLTAFVGDRAQELQTRYAQDDPTATPSQLYFRIYSDWSIGGAVLLQARRKSATSSAATYVYRFDFPSSALEGRLGAVHSSETPFVFGTKGPLSADTPEARDLSRLMQQAWVQFATHGEMKADGNPLWPRFDASETVMVLDRHPRTLQRPVPSFLEWATP